MLGPTLLNLMALAKWVGSNPSPQQYRRQPIYPRDYQDYSGQGDYTIRGFLSLPEDYDGLVDGRSYYSRSYPGYRRSYDGYYGRSGVRSTNTSMTAEDLLLILRRLVRTRTRNYHARREKLAGRTLTTACY